MQKARKVVSFLLMKKKYYIYGILILTALAVVLVGGLLAAILNSTDSGEEEQYGEGMVFDANGFGLGTHPLSALVEGYRAEIERVAKHQGIHQYTDLLLAKMMQESGGQGNDPMQSSESYCGYIGCIVSPSASIEQGVKHFKAVLKKAGNDVLLALQSYNFGGGFIDYVNKHNDGRYSKSSAIEFSKMMYDKVKHTGNYSCVRGDAVPAGACYGDVLYVEAVLKYYHPKSVAALTDIAHKPVLGSASGNLGQLLQELYQYEGMAYVFGGNNPSTGFDCSSLMQWGFNKIGVRLPRTANEQYKATKRISESDLKEGDLVFFTNTYNAGVPVTHVGIYVGKGHIFDANSSGVGYTDLSKNYWKSRIYGYGRAVDF